MTRTNQIRHKHHFVPELYLKQWGNEDGQICRYRTLVSNAGVPLWQRRSLSAVAYQRHLYSQFIARGRQDELEHWFDRVYETPAAEPLNRVVTGRRLTRDDWACLVRFVALQDVRTPARLIEMLQRWNRELPDSIDRWLKESIAELESLGPAERKRRLTTRKGISNRYFPTKVQVEKGETGHGGFVRFETVVGRSLWLFALEHLLTHTAKVLHRNRWSVLKAPVGFRWITSDNPVIRLNYYRNGKYDFGGGWGREGSEILMPVSPTHMLYTQIGHRPPLRGTRTTLSAAKQLQRFIAENAHRSIFAQGVDKSVPNLRQRVVSKGQWASETDQWKNWEHEQRRSEQEYAKRSGQ